MPSFSVVNISPSVPVNNFEAPACFVFGSNFYVMLTDGTKAQVFKSVDNGVTWVEKDIANEPVGPQCMCRKDATHLTAMIRFSLAGFQAIDFDTGSDTWGTPYANSGATDGDCSRVVVQSSGNLVAIIPVSGPGLDYGLFDGTWTFGNLLSGGVPSGINYGAYIAIDSTDVTHVIVITQSPMPIGSSYRQISAVGGLSAITDLLAATGIVVGGYIAIDETNGNLLIAETNQTTNRPQLAIGADLTSPAWSLTPDLSLLEFVGDEIAEVIGAKLYIIGTDLTGNIIQQLVNPTPATPATGWVTDVTYDVSSFLPSGPANSDTDSSKLTFMGSNGTYFLIGGSGPPPPPTPPTPVPYVIRSGVAVAGVWALPDARVKCNINGRMRCVILNNPKPQQRTKTFATVMR